MVIRVDSLMKSKVKNQRIVSMVDLPIIVRLVYAMHFNEENVIVEVHVDSVMMEMVKSFSINTEED